HALEAQTRRDSLLRDPTVCVLAAEGCAILEKSRQDPTLRVCSTRSVSDSNRKQAMRTPSSPAIDEDRKRCPSSTASPSQRSSSSRQLSLPRQIFFPN